jgi:hypothetical protein
MTKWWKKMKGLSNSYFVFKKTRTNLIGQKFDKESDWSNKLVLTTNPKRAKIQMLENNIS